MGRRTVTPSEWPHSWLSAPLQAPPGPAPGAGRTGRWVGVLRPRTTEGGSRSLEDPGKLQGQLRPEAAAYAKAPGAEPSSWAPPSSRPGDDHTRQAWAAQAAGSSLPSGMGRRFLTVPTAAAAYSCLQLSAADVSASLFTTLFTGGKLSHR